MATKDSFNRRCKDLNDQNSLLHQHLESVSTHAARIKQAASSTAAESGEAEATDDADTKVTELRSLVTYLRKEKEIVDLQLELGKQETARLRTQIEHLTSNLEETRKTLSEVRTYFTVLGSMLTWITGARTCSTSRHFRCAARRTRRAH